MIKHLYVLTDNITGWQKRCVRCVFVNSCAFSSRQHYFKYCNRPVELSFILYQICMFALFIYTRANGLLVHLNIILNSKDCKTCVSIDVSLTYSEWLDKWFLVLKVKRGYTRKIMKMLLIIKYMIFINMVQYHVRSKYKSIANIYLSVKEK